MKRKKFISAIVIASLLSPFSWAYSGGSGTPDDPYKIATVADWQQLMTTTDDWNKHSILTADLDLQGVILTPVGSYYRRFTGVFDGNGHIIRNAVIDLPGSDYVGLFGLLGDSGGLRDLGAEDVNITGRYYVGGLGTAIMSGLVGGLVGTNSGTLTACYATGDVNGDEYVGGLVGGNYLGTLTSCYAAGQVTAGYDVGGLVGWNFKGTLTDCYATGHVTGDYHVGGLVGNNLVHGTLTACFWDIETSGQTTSAGGQGKTTAQMKTLSTFTSAGWDFVDTWCILLGDYPRLRWQVECPGYSGGSGTQDDPYRLTAVADWQQLMNTTDDWDKHFILTEDLDLQGLALTPMGSIWTLPFTGVLDGQGHIIRNAVIDLPGSNYVGLFGWLGDGGHIRDLGAEDVNITGKHYVGGLVGWNYYGTLTSCYATGHVTGDVFVGGLVGGNWNSTLTACYATGQVTGGHNNVGGLVGDNYLGTVTACYATGQVTCGHNNVGGLVGNNHRGTVTACFWDTQTSWLSTSDGGQGKTTAQMKDINTFLDAGWDFVEIWGIGENQTYPFLRQYPAGDINHDDKVNFRDLAILAENWLAGR